MTSDGIFKNLTSWDPAPLRTALNKGGYHREGLEALGLPPRWLHSAVRRSALLGHVTEGSATDTLIRLFTLGDPVDGNRALHALGDSIHGLLEMGFLEAGGGNVRSRHQLSPTDSGWLAFDFQRRQGEDADDYVMGIGPSSRLLASLAPPLPGARVLELASGIGWLSGQLTQAGCSVVASDLNARALELGRFCARLNAITGIDFRHGEGFSAVAGERFDLIVANPPYVQSPGGNMTYKESRPGDPICARLLREIPNHLTSNGIAVVLINWSHTSDDDWTEPPLSWVPEQGTRRWLFQSDCSSPADYAWHWILGDQRFANEDAALNEIRRWLTYYQETGVKRLSAGFIVIQKCEAGSEWTRTDSRAAENIDISAGSDVLRVLNNESWLITNPPLLDAHFTVPEGVRAEASMSLNKDGWARETIRLTSPARLSYDGQIDENLLRLLAIVRSGGTPRDMLREIQSKPAFVALPDLPERVEALVRELVSHGVMVPVVRAG